MDTELISIIEKANIKIIENQKQLIVKSKCKLFNKLNFGVLGILVVSLIILIMFILTGSDWLTMILAVLFLGSIIALSILSIFKQCTDFIKVTNDEIQFMNSLTKKRYTLDPEMKGKMEGKTVCFALSFKPHTETCSHNIEIYLTYNKSEFRIFNFQMKDKDAKEANILGAEIVHKIKKRIIAAGKQD